MWINVFVYLDIYKYIYLHPKIGVCVKSGLDRRFLDKIYNNNNGRQSARFPRCTPWNQLASARINKKVFQTSHVQVVLLCQFSRGHKESIKVAVVRYLPWPKSAYKVQIANHSQSLVPLVRVLFFIQTQNSCMSVSRFVFNMFHVPISM